MKTDRLALKNPTANSNVAMPNTKWRICVLRDESRGERASMNQYPIHGSIRNQMNARSDFLKGKPTSKKLYANLSMAKKAQQASDNNSICLSRLSTIVFELRIFVDCQFVRLRA